MRVRQLIAFEVRLPLKREIAHASASRRDSHNLVVCCRLADGTCGWGEGVPRSYVTGETPDTCFTTLAATPLGEQLSADCASWPDVLRLCEALVPVLADENPRQCRDNALRCAVELSLLDAYGRLFGESLSRAFEHLPEAQPIRANWEQVRYSAAITAENRRQETITALKLRLYGFAQAKIKVGLPGVDDTVRLRRLRRWLGGTMDLRVDANEAWPAESALHKIEPLVPLGITCVEQPVRHEEVNCLAEVRRQVKMPLMLDESLTSWIDAQEAIRQQTCDLFNLRLSKCGGPIRCFRLAALARQQGLGYQLGCHPGESGILSAAGRHWAANVQNIRYLEGSYDRHLLADALVWPDITFGYGGRAPRLTGPGLGVTVRQDAVLAHAVRQEEYDVG